ncbi:MAG: sigma-54-dependent Fis family transcriptional regulator [Microcella sp.]
MSGEFDAQRAQALKEQILHSPPQEADDAGIVQSWRRSQAAIGDPGNIGEVPHVPEALLDEHLLDMFGAPMNRFAEDLEGTGLALLLADSRGQILQRWCEDRQSRSHLDRVGTTRGAVLAENTVGTNGVGTVIASGGPVQIRGTEHYADIYQNAVCTGAPVRHPITRRLLAVVTLSCDITPRSDLLKPLVKSMTVQLEQHVMSVEQPSTRKMFNVFLDQSRSRQVPVVAFGPQGVLIQSEQANQLTPRDMAVLRSLGDESRDSGRYVLELSSGEIEAELVSVGRGNHVVVLDGAPHTASRRVSPVARRPVGIAGRSPEWLALVSRIERARSTGEPVLLAGESGVGKTSLAMGAPYRSGSAPSAVILIDAAERHIVGSREWLSTLRTAFGEQRPVVIRGIETLDAPALDGLRALIDHRDATTPLVMTLATAEREDMEPFELKFGATGFWIPSLRDRVSDIPELWSALIASSAPDLRLELGSSALELMRAYHWPGNVKELRQLIMQLASAGKSGSIEAGDLPAAMQSTRNLSMIERMELEAIRKALQEAHGNRVKAADILGVSRATVYRKMKAYRLVG